MSRICAEFTEPETALEAHRALVNEGVPSQDIEIRSPYPLPEEAIPPHKSHPMKMRNWVRLFWLCGGIFGFSLAAGTQLDFKILTSGHPLVSIPIDAIITYECAMVTGLIMTLVFFFLETRRYRKLCPPREEDLPIAEGHIALIVEGDSTGKAEKILQSRGARSIVTLSLLLLLLPFFSGCAVRMRTQPTIKSTETDAVPKPEGSISMPTPKERALPFLKPVGHLLPEQIRLLDKKDVKTPPEISRLENPVSSTPEAVRKGQELFTEQCSFCHGLQAKGDGPVAELYMPKPPDLTAAETQKKSDGELFWRMTIGPSSMPSFANRLTTEERFTIVRFLRQIGQPLPGRKT